MNIPMEILSQVTTRTDSGAGVRQRSGSGIEETSSRFERMFEEELTKQGSKLIEKDAETKDKGKEVEPVSKKNNIEEDNTDEALAAGVMGNLQNEVVFILEGDITSTTTQKIHVENTTAPPPEPEQIVIPEKSEAKQEAVTTETREYAQVAEAVNAEQSKPANAEIKVDNNTGIFEDVMARKPDLGIQESRNDTDTSSKSFENGNPGPLENENDKTEIKGQNTKTYADTVNAINNAQNNETNNEAIASAQENQPVNDILPPLSEGIRPEQFQATQQMTQAALSAPVKTENLFQEMISRVEMMQNDTKSAMTIQLNPEFLGKVALEVSVDAAGLHVKINAEDSGVRSMINGQLTALIESLENKGIEVVEVEVIHTGINYGAFQDPREGENGQSKQQNAQKREVSSTEGVAFYTTLPDLMEYYLDTGVSSIEYRA